MEGKNEEIRIIIYQVIKVIFPICLKSECVQIEFPLNVLLRSLPKVYNSRLLSLLECTVSKVAEQDCQVRRLGSIQSQHVTRSQMWFLLLFATMCSYFYVWYNVLIFLRCIVLDDKHIHNMFIWLNENIQLYVHVQSTTC